MEKIVVTTGRRFVDIDGLAAVIAYQEIPEEETIAIIAGPLNQSVSAQIRKWEMNYLKDLTLTPDDNYKFVIADVSEPDQFPYFVDAKKVIEIYDHHFGFEYRWARLGEKCKIEKVGACATLIWEEFKKRKSQSLKITTLSANLLYTAILSNTLNFHSSLTTDRDKKAYEELKAFINLPDNWTALYFLDQEREVYKNPVSAINNDTKIQKIKGMECAVGQLELWNSRDFLREHKNTVESALKEFDTQIWFLISPCISEGRDYIFTRSETVKNFLRSVMDITFEGDIGTTSKLWLRKEILEKIQ